MNIHETLLFRIVIDNSTSHNFDKMFMICSSTFFWFHTYINTCWQLFKCGINLCASNLHNDNVYSYERGGELIFVVLNKYIMRNLPHF